MGIPPQRTCGDCGDYEALAMESSGSILKAKCFPGQGRVNLVLLLREHNRELENFDLVKRECLQYMEDKIPASLLENRKFRILEPQFIHMAVKAEIRVRDMNQILETRQRILKSTSSVSEPHGGEFSGKWLGDRSGPEPDPDFKWTSGSSGRGDCNVAETGPADGTEWKTCGA